MQSLEAVATKDAALRTVLRRLRSAVTSDKGPVEEGRIKVKQLVGELAPPSANSTSISISYLGCFIEHVLLLADTLHT